MVKLFILAGAAMALNCNAAGYTTWSKVTQVEYVNGGLLISGNFDDVNACGKSGYIYIKETPEAPIKFQTMTSMVLSAFAAQNKVRFHTKSCGAVSMHWSGDVINIAHTSGFYIKY